MQGRYSRISTAVVLLVGLIVGWSLSLLRPAPLHAGAGDRQGETIVTTGPVLVSYDAGSKAPIPLDALYILDYKGGRLLATIPTYRQSTSSTTVIESFVERDLAADFKLDLDTGPPPHFLMTTGSLGPFTAGWAPLYVVETTSNQMGVYRIHLQESSGKSSRPKFELVQLRSYAKKPSGTTPPGR
jgi:hypothetical protein